MKTEKHFIIVKKTAFLAIGHHQKVYLVFFRFAELGIKLAFFAASPMALEFGFATLRTQ
jgi:hypothetical protein